MPWIGILVALLPLLLKLLELLRKNRKIPERVKKRLAKCQGLMLQVNARACELGCQPEEE